jgi:hypothetical protein
MTHEMAPWEGVYHDVAEVLAARPAEYDVATRRNLEALLDFLRTSGRPAPKVEPGYWPTFNLSWDGLDDSGNLAIEVFDDRYEIYHFHEGRTDIRHEAYLGEGALPDNLVHELPTPSLMADPTAATS